MSVSTGMWNKAQRLIAADAEASHRAMGCCYPGARLKRHRPYGISARASMMVDALGSGDALRVSALILRWDDPGMEPSALH
jgi:hypothetical protein